MSSTKPWSEISAEARTKEGAAEEIATRTQAILDAIDLAKVRKHRKVTQTEMAGLMNTTQGNISRLERSKNPYIATLAEFVGTLGGTIEINAVFDDDVVPLAQISDTQNGQIPAS